MRTVKKGKFFRNPYSEVVWDSVNKIPSCSHQHCATQDSFDRIVASGWYEHYAFSNYYPSKPYYPLSVFFANVPDNALASPNAEHHDTNIQTMHINGLGSMLHTGSERHSDGTGGYVYDKPKGFEGTSWRTAFKRILDNLQYDDAGGVTINHPSWSNIQSGNSNLLHQGMLQTMLDYDDRVLGIEIFNNNDMADWDLEVWDKILLTGRRCWGFMASDHTGEVGGTPMGRNVLLVSTRDEHECLRAYRNGNYYCQLLNTALSFNTISYNAGSLNVSANGADYINIVIDGRIQKIYGSSAIVGIPSNSVYVRVEAHGMGDSIYSNPIYINGTKYATIKGNSNNIFLYS